MMYAWRTCDFYEFTICRNDIDVVDARAGFVDLPLNKTSHEVNAYFISALQRCSVAALQRCSVACLPYAEVIIIGGGQPFVDELAVDRHANIVGTALLVEHRSLYGIASWFTFPCAADGSWTLVANNNAAVGCGFILLDESNARYIHVLSLVFALMPCLIWRTELPYISFDNRTVGLHGIHSPIILSAGR